MISLERIRADFPSLESRVYLNTAAEGIPPRQVGAALHAYWEDKLVGMDGRDAHYRIEAECRAAAAGLLGLSAGEIGLCSCSAEAYNLLSSAPAFEPDDEVVINDLDFPSGITFWLTGRNRPTVRLWKSADGVLRLEDLAPLLTAKTRLVQTSLVSFYNGYRIPWQPFSEMVRQICPAAILAVDATQALGRCVLDCTDADILISSTHKWLLGLHGGCIVAVPACAAHRITTHAAGWHHLIDAFGAERFTRAEAKPGAAGFAVGMPSYAPIYALNAALRYLAEIGVPAIAAYADPLAQEVHGGLVALGLSPLAPYDPACPSGIVAFRHPAAEQLRSRLHDQGIHLMRADDRLRAAVHAYNTPGDIARFLAALKTSLEQTGL